MNKEIMKSAGFEREVKLVEKGGKCPFCKSYIDVSQFRDKLSRKEFGISGMCQACQDEFFGKEND
jgi:hypothetical protein